VALVTERRFESPGDAIAALMNTEKAATEYKTAADKAAEALKAFEHKPGNWAEGLDEKASNLVKQKGWKDIGSVIKSYENLETAFGADKAGRTLLLPKNDQDTEARDLIYTRLGRPENAEKYVYKAPEGVQIDNDLVKMSKDIAFKSGMNQSQYDAMAKAWDDLSASKMAEMGQVSQTTLAEEYATLTKEWGSRDGPAWVRQMSVAKKATEHFKLANAEGKSVIDAMQNTAGYAATMRFFANVGEQLMESGGPGEEGGKGTFAMTPAEAKIAYGQRQLDKAWMDALKNKSAPGHDEAVAERKRFLSIIYPGGV
jgi:hypothetical protein